MLRAYPVTLIVFACEQVQKSKRPTKSTAISNGCDPGPTKVDAFVPLSSDRRILCPFPSICLIQINITISWCFQNKV